VRPDGVAFAVACARAAAGGAPPSAAPQNWSAALDALRAHRLLPLAGRAMLEGAWPQAAPGDETRRALNSELRESGARALARCRQAAELAAALHDAGVRALAYKGPALAYLAHGDPSVRESVDVDVLVARRDRSRAERVLGALGYRPAALRALERRVLFAWEGASPWWRSVSDAPVELHWRACELRLPWKLPFGELFERATRVPLAGVMLSAPAPDDALLLLAWHGTRHAWSQLEWVASWAALARRHPPDWRAIRARARRVDGARALDVSVSVAASIGALDPFGGSGALDAGAGWLETLLPTVNAGWNAKRESPAIDRTAYRRFVLAALERPSHRARYVALGALLPTDRDLAWWRLPPWAAFAYPLVRLTRLLARTLAIPRSDPAPPSLRPRAPAANLRR
jgi:hypothetical protein